MTDVVKLEWQDIANAPRDGSPVLLRHYAHDQRPYVAMWKETVCPGLPWVSTLLDHAWPEDAFTHYVAFADLEALKAELDYEKLRREADNKADNEMHAISKARIEALEGQVQVADMLANKLKAENAKLRQELDGVIKSIGSDGPGDAQHTTNQETEE